MDHFFSSSSLLNELKHGGFYAIDAVMVKRNLTWVKRKFPSNKKMVATRRGTHVEFVRGYVHVKWLDKRGVILLSTVDSAEPTECSKRWSKPIRLTLVSLGQL